MPAIDRDDDLRRLWRTNAAAFCSQPFTITRRKLTGARVEREFEVSFRPGEEPVAALIMASRRTVGLLPKAAFVLAHILLEGPLFDLPDEASSARASWEQWEVRRASATLRVDLAELPRDFWALEAICDDLEQALAGQPEAG
jgi:hypothetical protein